MAVQRIVSGADLLAARRLLAVRLRLEGHSFPIIAQVVEQQFAEKGFPLPASWGARSAANDVQRAMDVAREQLRETTSQLRELELQRLDALFAVVWSMAMQGQQSAVDRCIKLMQRRSDLLGLDVPKAVDISTELVVRYVNDWRNPSAQAALRAGDSNVIDGTHKAVGGGEEVAEDDDGRLRLPSGTQGGTGTDSGSAGSVGSSDLRSGESGMGRMSESVLGYGDLQSVEDVSGDPRDAGEAIVSLLGQSGQRPRFDS